MHIVLIVYKYHILKKKKNSIFENLTSDKIILLLYINMFSSLQNLFYVLVFFTCSTLLQLKWQNLPYPSLNLELKKQLKKQLKILLPHLQKRDHKFINISHINYQGGLVTIVRKTFLTKQLRHFGVI